jgi:hypothetical protein
MVDIPESERYNIGAGLYYDENVNELGVRVTKPIAFNNGALTINENDLFTVPIEEYAIDTPVAVPTDKELIVFDVTPNWGPNQTNGWIEQIINNGMKTFIKFDVDNDWVFGGEYFPNYTIGGTAINGVSYEYVFDMSFVIGPNVQANTGIHTI